MPQPIRVMFVCLGNICRSPMAEAIFIDRLNKRSLRDRFIVDSCGTGHWHVGGPADARTVRTLHERSVKIDHVARQLNAGVDSSEWDLFVVMDSMNYRNVLAMGVPREKVRMAMSFVPAHRALGHEAPAVPDPYEGTMDDFGAVYDMLGDACDAMINELLASAGATTGARS
ncbi:MAG: low molecular weight phosphotyrosine protein phosphatase [Phycisphaerales bacterium]|nr:low molecular weight phosphotyrosine protein phosphatase [Phycisphaerales bacterium]